jgi:hypothetical protein
MKYKIEIKTEYGNYQLAREELTEAEFNESMEAMCKLLSDGTYLQFDTVDGKKVILSREVLRNCILEVTPLEQ